MIMAEITLIIQKTKLPIDKDGIIFSELDHTFVESMDLYSFFPTFPVPVKGSAVIRIIFPVHTDLIPIIDVRGADKCHLKEDSKLE